ncbi:uncharacterized protein LAESUDRAFT_719885 [Laetiporus sulphureus 93-53]|uniref:F-box domain-containing protein n=1 Tax=Laetiporus sulphureus 93-53 TaxID=1314785 RepID=A0A165HMT6_9APHY|nr:uncharacterized protein LAESUDRAFT_719885 [Laetiporus sulphureus 93-53]KZT11941.1 hypothetical protein LAESUDRAFT_719885 [Laetiporus sulphureus 93-53]
MKTFITSAMLLVRGGSLSQRQPLSRISVHAALSESPLPLDVYEEILTYLHGDIHALCTCSLVCRAWLPSTRSYIFREVTLKRENFKSFHHLLHHTPALGIYVKALTILHSELGVFHWPSTQSEMLRQLIAYLRSVTSLKLTCFMITPPVMDALASVLPGVRDLVLDSVGAETAEQLADFMRHISQLRSLTLDGDVFLHPEGTAISRPSNVQTIWSRVTDTFASKRQRILRRTRRISLLPADYILYGMLSRINHARQNPYDMCGLAEKGLSTVLAAASPTLQRLTFRNHYDCIWQGVSPSLAHHDRLDYIDFVGGSPGYWAPDYNVLVGFLAQLRITNVKKVRVPVDLRVLHPLQSLLDVETLILDGSFGGAEIIFVYQCHGFDGDPEGTIRSRVPRLDHLGLVKYEMALSE